MVAKLFLLIAGHALGDFVLQSELMAEKKNPWKHFAPNQGTMYMPPWYYWMLAHGLVHGAIVYLITGSLFCGIGEVVLHITIDLFKCKRKINMHVDQILHILCKINWILA